MSNSTQMDRVLDGMLNFNAETKETLDSIKETIDKVFDKHYQANHTPYAVMSFEDEYHYWEEQLAEAINRVEYSDYDVLEPKGVEMLQKRSYVIVRGNLKSGNTIHFDNTKFNQLYINGERYTGDYVFNGETSETYERLVIVVVQTPFNLGQKIYGNLDILSADFPIENAEIYVNIGKFSELQPNIEELLLTDTTEGLYVNGPWVWKCRDVSFIKTLSVSETLSIHSEAWRQVPALVNYFIPNSQSVLQLNSKAILNIDIRNAGMIEGSAFEGSCIKGHLDLSNTGIISISAFQNCSRLTSVNIGNGVTSINNNVFSGCLNLNTIIISDNVEFIGSNAFSLCPTRVLHLGKSILFGYNTSQFTHVNNGNSVEELTVSKGYHSPYTYFNGLYIAVDNCLEIFKNIFKNCANVGEDERTAERMSFKVKSDVFNILTNSTEILDICTEKCIDILK